MSNSTVLPLHLHYCEIKIMVIIPAKIGGNHNGISNTRSSQAVAQLMEKPMSHGLQRQNNEKCTHEDPIGWLKRKQI